MRLMLRALAVAMVASLLLPAATFAASNSYQTTENLTVLAAGSISTYGMPASVNLGTWHAGDSTGPIEISDNLDAAPVSLSSFSVSLAQSDLTGTGPTISAATSVRYYWDPVGYENNASFSGISPSTFPAANPVASGGSTQINFGLAIGVVVPQNAVGSYTGVLTLSLSGSY